MTWPQYVMPIQTINKLKFALESIQTFADSPTPEGNLAMISVIASETLAEVAPEIEAIKAKAMAEQT